MKAADPPDDCSPEQLVRILEAFTEDVRRGAEDPLAILDREPALRGRLEPLLHAILALERAARHRRTAVPQRPADDPTRDP